jgi:ABC-type ATPase involved in cell division
MSKILKIELAQFTAFEKATIEFSVGINIIIGENGTGKTHLLKVLYASCAISTGEDRDKSFALKLRNVFSPYEGRIGRLARRQKTSVSAKITTTRQGNLRLTSEFSNHTNHPEDVKTKGETGFKKAELISAYIPVKEMLAHAPGFLATVARREIAFEEVYSDIIRLALLPKLKGPPATDRQRLLTALEKAIDGKVVAKGEHLFLKNKQGELEFSLLAEGVRKLALVWLLIQNGTLLSGSVLFWDEPEANLNPKLIGEVVEVILELQRLGVQIFLSTHNYVLLKEFDLRQRSNDKLQFLSLYRSSEGAVSVSSSANYLGVDPNAISGTFNSIFDREIQRNLGGIAK